MRKLLHCITLALVASLFGCEHSEPFFSEGGSRLVIEGYIDSAGYPLVILTTSASGGTGSLSECIVNWGKVTISDGDTSIILTGGPDKNHFPPYSYRTYAMQGKPGKTYTLTAEYGALKASAVSKMPWQSLALRSIELEPVEGSDTLRSITVNCTTLAPGYVKIYSRVWHKDVQSLPSPLSNYCISETDENLTMQAYRGKSMLADDNNYSPHFAVGDTVELRIATVTKETYDFWTAYDNSTTFGSAFISAPMNITGNVDGGYGLWSAQSALLKTIIIE